jgi:D-3-phosphoglycerate dehydrogenase / 2-oxoglutarate reductase
VSDPIEALILDLLEWIDSGARTQAEVIDVWRTSCPRLPVWEEASERGFVERRDRIDHGTVVTLTSLGRDYLAKHRPRRVVKH